MIFRAAMHFVGFVQNRTHKKIRSTKENKSHLLCQQQSVQGDSENKNSLLFREQNLTNK
jgi:hypothetical protein